MSKNEESKYAGDAPTSELSSANVNARQLSFGEKAVGITFNPGKNEKVESIKRKFADVIDELHNMKDPGDSERHPEKIRMLSIAITEAQTAQMWAVKAATWQY